MSARRPAVLPGGTDVVADQLLGRPAPVFTLNAKHHRGKAV